MEEDFALLIHSGQRRRLWLHPKKKWSKVSALKPLVEKGGEAYSFSWLRGAGLPQKERDEKSQLLPESGG